MSHNEVHIEQATGGYVIRTECWRDGLKTETTICKDLQDVLGVVTHVYARGGEHFRIERVEQSPTMKEQLADLYHRQWAGWMRYLFRFGTQNENGTFTMGADKVERWRHQMETSYSELSLAEQDSDCKEADKFLEVIGRYVHCGVKGEEIDRE